MLLDSILVMSNTRNWVELGKFYNNSQGARDYFMASRSADVATVLYLTVVVFLHYTINSCKLFSSYFTFTTVEFFE